MTAALRQTSLRRRRAGGHGEPDGLSMSFQATVSCALCPVLIPERCSSRYALGIHVYSTLHVGIEHNHLYGFSFQYKFWQYNSVSHFKEEKA